jgi:ferredoxin
VPPGTQPGPRADPQQPSEDRRFLTMRIHVDSDMCDLHGQCVFAAPEIFSFDDAGELVYQSEVDDALAAKAQNAASVCPVSAIELTP